MKQKILQIYYKFIWKLASFYIKRKSPTVIGITWSVWKTSCRMIIYQTLQKLITDKKIYTSQKNFNGELGLSFSIFKINHYSPTLLWLATVSVKIILKFLFTKPDYDIIILEYGIDHIKEMDFMLSIVKPDIGIVTKIDKVHSMQLGNPNTTAQEKYKLLLNTKKIAFLNVDDEYAPSFFPKIKAEKYYFSTYWNKAHITFQNIHTEKDNNNNIYTTFETIFADRSVKVKTNLFWKENYAYIWLGLLIAEKLWYKPADKLQINFQLQPWRFTILKWVNNSILIDSSYNCAPASCKKLIENTFSLKQQLFKDYKIILAIGDMRELGKFTETEHRQIASYIQQVADYVVLVWPCMSKFTQDELVKIWFPENKIKTFLSSKKAWKHIKNILQNSPDRFLILFKWSQNTIFMEEAIKEVLLNKSDYSLLPRQSKEWMKRKNV